MPKKISFFSLVLLIIAAIDSIRNLSASALFGPALVFLFIAAGVFFLIPIALVSAELSAGSLDKGGVYHWVGKAFGEHWAMLAIWLQWINTMVWYPTILSFIAGTAAYLIDPALAQSKIYLVSSILIIFWTMTFLNLFGVHFSAKINGVCAIFGTVFPMLLLILLGFIWMVRGDPLQIHINLITIFPSFHDSVPWVSLIAVMASLLGMELAGVHVGDIRNPQINFPRAVLCGSGFILFSMLFGSLSIAWVIPAREINLLSGVMQVFSRFFIPLNMHWCVPVMAILIVLGTLGSIINWLISPAKGLMQAAESGFLPLSFAKKNKYDVAPYILLMQAVLVSLFCVAFLLVPSINGFYWFLTALSTSMYMMMYILIFLSALILRLRNPRPTKNFRVPGGVSGVWVVVLFGLASCLATIGVSFLPPQNIDVGAPLRYVLMIAAGSFTLLSPVPLFFLYKRYNMRSTEKY